MWKFLTRGGAVPCPRIEEVKGAVPTLSSHPRAAGVLPTCNRLRTRVLSVWTSRAPFSNNQQRRWIMAGFINCEQYVAICRKEELSLEDSAFLEQHEAKCPVHSDAGTERELELPTGALKNGAPECGVPVPRNFMAKLIREHGQQ